MGRSKLIGAGVVVLAGLVGLVVVQKKRDDAVGRPVVDAKDFPTVSASDDVDKISITNAEKGEVVLEKQDDKWMVTKPVKAKANQDFVKDLVKGFASLKIESAAAIALDEESKKEKELDTSHGVHVVAWKGADKKLDEIFGKSGSAGQLMILPDNPKQAWMVKGYSSYMYTRTASNWRDKQLFKFDDAAVAQITIQSPTGPLSFTSNGTAWGGTFKGAPIERFDQDKMKALLGAMKSLNADDFGDGKTATEVGLDHPEASILVTLKDNAGKFELKVGQTAAGTSRYVMKPEDPTIFTLSQWSADWIVGGVSKFQKPLDAGAAPVAAAGKPAAPAPKH